ncbi:Uncharacterised protein [Capnocytophaga ochracea]|uniref:ATP phosphoribosyltransferase n=1 Tax=Capnocytophaga ochracea TaxID=1018 RepID=A0A2X2SXQ7_CAPOC|nr:hypothetical protein [Capnocytophaga ochracea]SQA94491.1 Uncharacterised protein [Capnocytophaga ochracea]
METITVALPKGLSLKNAKSVLESLNFKIVETLKKLHVYEGEKTFQMRLLKKP